MARIRKYSRRQGRWMFLLLVLLLLLAACGAEPATVESPATEDTVLTEPAEPSEPEPSLPVELRVVDRAAPAYDVGYPVMRLPEELPAIDWAAIPVGAAEETVLPTLGIEEIIDTSPTEGADSLFDIERLAPLAGYALWPGELPEGLPEAVAAQLQVQLAGIPLDHISICCRGGGYL